MATTPTYAWRYQGLSDSPHGPNLGANLALDIEADFIRMDTPADWQMFISSGTCTAPADYKQAEMWAQGAGPRAADPEWLRPANIRRAAAAARAGCRSASSRRQRSGLRRS